MKQNCINTEIVLILRGLYSLHEDYVRTCHNAMVPVAVITYAIRLEDNLLCSFLTLSHRHYSSTLGGFPQFF